MRTTFWLKSKTVIVALIQFAIGVTTAMVETNKWARYGGILAALKSFVDIGLRFGTNSAITADPNHPEL
jgi:hypothetical protein